jgi:biopolymer transport protein TolR
MAMSSGKKGGFESEPNLTPMIDVLLVLLIIFMVIIPMGRKAFDVQLPDPTAPPPPKDQKVNQIVLEVLPGDRYQVNKKDVSKSELFNYLKDVYKERPEKIMFVKGDPEVKYQDVIYGMDMARGAGVKVIGATPRAVAAGAAKAP